MYIQMTDTYGRVWLVPAAVQFQQYGLRDFLNDLALVLGLVVTIRTLSR
jgi:hypothetical protein